MKHLLGYLQLENDVGQCVELINGARTLALMEEAGRKHQFWSERDISSVRRWYGNECWAFGSGQYGADSALWADPMGEQDINPWQDDDDPRTLEVAGFLPDPPGNGTGLVIESPAEDRVITSSRIEPLEFSITGTVVAATERGEHQWLAWATRVLTDGYAYRYAWRGTVFTHCPCEADWDGVDPFDLPIPDNGEPTYPAAWDTDPLASGNLLAEWTDPTPWPIDSGLRQLFDVRFVAIDPLLDQPLFPHCVGRRYTIRFTVGRHYIYDRPRTLASIGGAGNWASGEVYTLPLDPNPPEVSDPYDPGPPGLAVPNTPGRWSGLRARAGRWRRPDGVLRVASLTPPRPSSLQDRLVLTVHNPSLTSAVYNARLVIWEAIVGQPHPNTVVGDAYYRNRSPVAELRIVRMEPAETLVFDGRTRRTQLSRPSGIVNNVAGRVEGPGGTRVEAPILSCNERYWVCAEMSSHTGSYGDLDLEVTLEAAEQDIPT